MLHKKYIAMSIKKQVWVIDDDNEILEIVSEALSSPRIVVTTFGEAGSALFQISQKTQKPDVILCDLKMEQIDGFSVLERLKKEKIDIPIIFITAYRSVEAAVQAIRKGAFDFITKPLNLNQLELCVERAFKISSLQKENELLKLNLQGKGNKEIIAKSESLRQILTLVERIASTAVSVLITGESGTGKEVIAQAIHTRSDRASKPFIAVNCSAIPEALLESELFGHAKGAFTGAVDKRQGLFEEAHEGTLLLDEIGELNQALQAKLLRVIQEKKIKRVGENTYRDVDVRVLAATHRNIKKMVREGTFREDLYFRLNVIPIHIPPLRDRKEDLLPLALYFLKRSCRTNGIEEKRFTQSAINKILTHEWKGNVRELENTMERAVLLSDGQEIDENFIVAINDDYETSPTPIAAEGGMPGGFPSALEELPTLEEMNLHYIHHVLKLAGNVRDRAAKILGIDRKTLYRKLNDEKKDSWLQDKGTSLTQ